ncbi:MAG: hypothetical protein K0Q50_1019 [Vampirovibrio sp.]|jgi:hypothetical protein|nr:hypothetical protein [Vampirovibrio sp.]
MLYPLALHCGEAVAIDQQLVKGSGKGKRPIAGLPDANFQRIRIRRAAGGPKCRIGVNLAAVFENLRRCSRMLDPPAGAALNLVA